MRRRWAAVLLFISGATLALAAERLARTQPEPLIRAEVPKAWGDVVGFSYRPFGVGGGAVASYVFRDAEGTLRQATVYNDKLTFDVLIERKP